MSEDRVALLEEAHARAYRALVAMGVPPPDAADAIQDAVERALNRGSADWQRVERPEAWLFVVALRRWRTQRWRNRLFVPLGAARRLMAEPGHGETAMILIEELKRLPQRERQVLVARYILGLSQRETAEYLGIALGTVAATTAHATRKLKERLDAGDGRARSEPTTAL